MNRLDFLWMDFILHLTRLSYRLMFFIMFRKKAQCKHFCLTCQYFDECMEDVKSQYAAERLKDNTKNSGQ